MIKSKFSIFGFWFLSVATMYITLNFISAVLEFFFRITIFKPLTLGYGQSDHLVFQIIVFSLLAIYFIPVVCLNADIVTIDSLSKIISFKNVFTKRERTYSFTEFDGFANTFYRQGYAAKFYVIYLVKGDKRIEKISSYYYLNYKKLNVALDGEIAYLGDREFDFFKNLKILFRQKVMD